MHTTYRFAALLGASILFVYSAWSQITPKDESSKLALSRRYRAGETYQYRMKGNNQDWEYQILATDMVKQDEKGTFYESIGWSDLESNAPMTLSPAMLAFRQTLSLAPGNAYLTVPDLSKVQPSVIGPITDLLTFYSDLFLASTLKLGPQHSHAYFSRVHLTHGPMARG